jgi:prepilin-type N-terminal cleavage/methylation domain-containing protein
MSSAHLHSAGCAGISANSYGRHIDMGADTMNVLGRGLAMYSKSSRSAFTLVELLVVISIIGVLVAITVPSVMAVRVSFLQSAVRFEVDQFATALEQYRTKYGEYPPDGSSWPIMEAHLRRAFPEMIQSEMEIFRATRDQFGGQAMSRSQAVVFFLGGFSEDKQRPFTGKGGPFQRTPTGLVFNTTRDNSFYEFESGNYIFPPSGRPARPYRLPLPSYTTYQSQSPIVYFDSRSYVIKGATRLFYNSFEANSFGEIPEPTESSLGGDFLLVYRAMPLLSEQFYKDLTLAEQQNRSNMLPFTSPDARVHVKNFENSDTFQLMSSGLDGRFGFSTGNELFASRGDGVVVDFSATRPYTSFATIKRFNATGGSKNFALDNSTNCIDVKNFGLR